MLNIISLAKMRKVMARKSDVINYNNHHSAVNNTINDSKLVELLVEENIFKE